MTVGTQVRIRKERLTSPLISKDYRTEYRAHMGITIAKYRERRGDTPRAVNIWTVRFPGLWTVSLPEHMLEEVYPYQTPATGNGSHPSSSKTRRLID